ncbi:hypothetical protein AB3R30_13935 [Leptolyngbyaceae cyanobacterium UHCC 1019]
MLLLAFQLQQKAPKIENSGRLRYGRAGKMAELSMSIQLSQLFRHNERSPLSQKLKTFSQT